MSLSYLAHKNLPNDTLCVALLSIDLMQMSPESLKVIFSSVSNFMEEAWIPESLLGGSLPTNCATILDLT